ncbi:MAG: hypothetical protein LN560_05735 [Rickettsia endosymbiont of Sceptobius lativentris]|nr:hypothetical protein [Rickettsia endosymbiont of Sceptobius lativentris]
MNNTGITNKANVFFMDDDEKHIKAAKDITAVWVKKDDKEYIQKAFNFLYKFNEQHEIYVELNRLDTEHLLSEEDVRQEIIKTIPFDPYYSDGEEYTPSGEGNVPTLGNS